jgi:hypothetical protein
MWLLRDDYEVHIVAHVRREHACVLSRRTKSNCIDHRQYADQKIIGNLATTSITAKLATIITIEYRLYNQLDAQFSLFNNSIISCSSTCFERHSAHPQEDIVYMQYLVFSRSVCCHTWHRLICATYGSIQSVRKPDTAYIQCPPEDERCDARNM